MSHKPSEFSIIVKESDSPQSLPSGFSELHEILQFITQSGMREQLFTRLFLTRKAGSYVGFDLFLLLSAFFLTGNKHRGLGSYTKAPFTTEVAALGQRKRLPSQSAAAQMFKSLSQEQVEAFSDWLLSESLLDLMKPLMKQESVLNRDAQGQAWQVFFLITQ